MGLTVLFGLFVLMELTNVGTLYFHPGSRLFNGVGVFRGWEESKKEPHLHDFVRYLVYWVAGTKLIFIGLILAILWLGSPVLKQVVSVVMVLSILSFFWRLFPLIRKLDQAEQITPKGYSRQLGWMIAGFVLLFVVAFVVSL